MGGNAYWRLLEWRGDNYVLGWYALSNLSPDLVLECISHKANQYLGISIAVECKYRNKRNDFLLERRQIRNYEEYIAERQIKYLFFLFGFGWKNNAPEEVYLIPSKAIYEYDIDSGRIKFLDTLDETKKESKFKNYKVILDKSKGKCHIQYKKKQNNF